jgi:long-chain fatty acid transport protein
MTRRPGIHSSVLTAALGLLVCAPTLAQAGGYAVYTHGASALGQGNAVVANGDDPSVIFFNPALLSQLPGTQVQAGTTLIFSSGDFRSDLTGRSSDKDSDLFLPSTFYFSHRFNDKVSAGLGVFSPFGLGNDWGKEWEGRFIATNSELKSFNVNPVLSLQVNPKLALAGGLNFIYLDSTLERQLRATALGIPIPGLEVGQKFSGDGTGIGFNLGMLLDLTDDLALGVSYRSEIKVDITGDVSFATPEGFPVPLPGMPGKTDLTLPQQAFAGLYYKGFDPLTFEVGMLWEGWSSFEELRIELPDGSSTVTPRDWNNSLVYNLGVRYRLNPTVTLLAGYLYGETPVPDHTFDPSIPDSDTHLFSLGTDLNFNRCKVAFSYAYQRFESRTKNNLIGASPVAESTDLANGTYKSDLHMVALGLTYRF